MLAVELFHPAGLRQGGALSWLLDADGALAIASGETKQRPRPMDAEATQASQIMARYCAGEVAAFHQLYALLSPRVLAYLRSLIGERAAAEDLLQQTFLKVHEARASYVRGANPIPWIYTIAHRTCLDELRKRKRSRVRLTSDGDLPAPQADITGTAVDAQAAPPSPRAGAAMAALQHLPENQRQALILTKVHGRSHAEAAQIAGSTPGAIKLRAHRAYVTLRQLLGKKTEEEIDLA